MSEKTVKLTMPKVLPLIANPSFYQVVPGFDAVREEARAFRAKLSVTVKGLDGKGGCRGCTKKKVIMQEYLRLYTSFVKAYTRQWYADRLSLRPILDFLGAGRVEMPVRKGGNPLAVE